jgi:hypothetical protein
VTVSTTSGFLFGRSSIISEREQMMYWIVIAILALIALTFFLLYWRGVKARLYLRCFLIQLLLDEETYEFQKEGLKKLVLNTQAKDAMELGHRVNNSIDRLVSGIGSNTILASRGLLWKTKKDS